MMTQLLYTKSSCLQMIDTLKRLKADNALRLNEFQEQSITAERNLNIVQKLEGLIDFCEEMIYDRLKELEKEQT